MRWNYRNKEIYRVPFTDTTNVFKIGCKWITLFSYSSIVSIATGIVKYCIFTVVFFRLIKLISFQYTNHSNFQSKTNASECKNGLHIDTHGINCYGSTSTQARSTHSAQMHILYIVQPFMETQRNLYCDTTRNTLSRIQAIENIRQTYNVKNKRGEKSLQLPLFRKFLSFSSVATSTMCEIHWVCSGDIGVILTFFPLFVSQCSYIN